MTSGSSLTLWDQVGQLVYDRVIIIINWVIKEQLPLVIKMKL